MVPCSDGRVQWVEFIDGRLCMYLFPGYLTHLPVLRLQEEGSELWICVCESTLESIIH